MAINRKSTVTASTQHACVGSLAAHLDKFAEFLVGEGYVSQTIKAKYALAADLSHWLKQRGVPLAKLDEARLTQFHAHRRGSRRRGDVSTGHQLLELLRRLGVVPAAPQKVDQTALGRLTRDYERFLSSERGLAPATLISYLPIVRRFLTAHFGNKALRLQDLQPQDLHRFILRQFRRAIAPIPSSWSRHCARSSASCASAEASRLAWPPPYSGWLTGDCLIYQNRSRPIRSSDSCAAAITALPPASVITQSCCS